MAHRLLSQLRCASTRRSPPAAALLAAVAAGLVAGCFTDPINQMPTVQTNEPNAPIYHGEAASFTFTASDPDHDDLTLTWGYMSGVCPPDVTSATWQGVPMPAMRGQPLLVGADVTRSAFCVCTFVVDSHDAGSQSCISETPGNRAPVPVIIVKEPTGAAGLAGAAGYDLYARFRLSAADALDPEDDPVTVGPWIFLDRPAGSQAEFVPCPMDGGDASDACFTADAPGVYRVRVTVSDDHGGRGTADQTLTVAEDRLPCLGASSPDWTQPTFSWPASQDKAFTILSVVDDFVDDSGKVPLTGAGDRIHFTWYEGPADGPLLYQGDDFPTFTRAANPAQLGETRRVRVEIRDNAGNDERIKALLIGCQDQALCAARDGCFIRATWTVRYNL